MIRDFPSYDFLLPNVKVCFIKVNKSPAHPRGKVSARSPCRASPLRRRALTSTAPGGRTDRRSQCRTSTARPLLRAGCSSPGTCWPAPRCVHKPPRLPLPPRLPPRPRQPPQTRPVRTCRCLLLLQNCSSLCLRHQQEVIVPQASTNCLNRWKKCLARWKTLKRRRGIGSLSS